MFIHLSALNSFIPRKYFIHPYESIIELSMDETDVQTIIPSLLSEILLILQKCLYFRVEANQEVSVVFSRLHQLSLFHHLFRIQLNHFLKVVNDLFSELFHNQ